MTEQNIHYFQKVEDILGEKVSLQSLPRVSYLTEYYHKNTHILDILYNKRQIFN